MDHGCGREDRLHRAGLAFDTAAPTATSTAAAAPAGAATETYAVLFFEAVSGVDAADFRLAATGSAGGRIASVSGSGESYTVTVADIAGQGSLALALAAGATVQDAAGNALSATGLPATTAGVHLVDRGSSTGGPPSAGQPPVSVPLTGTPGTSTAQT